MLRRNLPLLPSTQTKCGILRHLLNRIKEMMKGDEGAQKERFVKALTAAQDNLKTIGEDAPLVVSLLDELKKSDVNKDEVIKAFVSKVEAIIKEKCQQQENVKAEPSATASTQTKCGILRHLLNRIKEMMKGDEGAQKERFVKALTAAQDNLKNIGEDAPLVVSLLDELKKSDVNKDEVIKAFVGKVEAIIKEKCQTTGEC